MFYQRVKLSFFIFLCIFLNSCTVRMNEDVFHKLPLVISPEEKEIYTKPGGIFFNVRGGKPPYEYSVIDGNGVVSDGYFEAQEIPGVTIIEVRDQLNQKKRARITVIKRENE